MPNGKSHSNYDEEPVFYCSKCYSLKIKYEDSIDAECCMDCGCSDILSTSIDKWEEIYKNRYGDKYVNEQHNVKGTPIFNMPISRLKMILFDSPYWKDIIRSLYPRFPKKLSKVDSIILLFDKVIKDKRLDDLRLLLNKFTNY